MDDVDLVNVFRNLLKDVKDVKEETGRLNRKLVLEQEEFKEALKAEREKREEAVKGEREKREEALKVEKEERERERAERQSEKIEADKKYKFLQNYIVDVEETTMDTVGWIANNVGHHLFSA